MTPQEETIKTYQENFDMYKEKTPSQVSGEFIDWMDRFTETLPDKAAIFELGSAQGRDATYLRDKGFIVFCTDIIPQALEELQKDGFATAYYDFRTEPEGWWLGRYDAILAKAVFLHATQVEFEKAIPKLLSLLRGTGILCLSFKLGEGEEIETDKLGGIRYFKYYSEEDLGEIFSKHPLSIANVSKTIDGKWIQFVLRKNS